MSDGAWSPEMQLALGRVMLRTAAFRFVAPDPPVSAIVPPPPDVLTPGRASAIAAEELDLVRTTGEERATVIDFVQAITSKSVAVFARAKPRKR